MSFSVSVKTSIALFTVLGFVVKNLNGLEHSEHPVIKEIAGHKSCNFFKPGNLLDLLG